jgi:hypothetical protein
VAVLGGYAYLADDFGLRVIDVSSPSAPMEVGFIPTPSFFAWGVAVSNGHVYIAGGDEFGPEGGLLVVDVSTPSAPVEVGFYETVNDRFDVSVSGGYVFLTTDVDGLYVFRECGVFVDGFESGDTSAWSVTMP